MTHQEMIDYVAGQLRNTKIASTITTWLNLASDKIGLTYSFSNLLRYASVNTAAGNPDVTLQTDFHWLYNAQIPTEDRKLYPEDESRIAASNPRYRTEQGQPDWYYLKGNIMGLWRVPSGIKAITYSYQKRPTQLSLPSDVSELPVGWHELVCEYAIKKGGRYQRSPDLINEADANIRRLLIELNASQYKRPDYPLVMGDTSYLRRPAPPRFPANYPKVRRY